MANQNAQFRLQFPSNIKLSGRLNYVSLLLLQSQFLMHYQERAQTKNNGNNPALKEFNKLKHLLSRYVLEWFKIIMLIANHFYQDTFA